MSEGAISTRVAIAGGGPAGIMLGYLLARAGIEVAVLEKWPDFFRDFRGDTIHPSTMEILQELGLLEEFLRLPHSEMTRMTFHFGKLEATIADFSKLKTPAPYIAFVPQWDFLTFLAQKGKQFPAFRLLMATEATELLWTGGRVTGLMAKDADGPLSITADLVIGADGRHSMVRQKGGFDIEELSVPIDVLWFRIARHGVDNRESVGHFEHGVGLVMLDRHDYWQCAFIIRKGQYEAMQKEGLDAFRRRVEETARLPQGAASEVNSWDKVKFLSVSVDRVRTWAKEGVLLIGDAAHAMSPIGGVGINYAIQDAVATANILIPALAHGEASLSVLQKVQARREPPVRRIQRLQIFLQDRVLFPSLRNGKAMRAPLFLRLLARFPLLRRIPSRVIGMGFLPEHIAN